MDTGRRLIMALLRHLGRGLMVYGIALTGARPRPVEGAPPPEPASHPPAGHPERLAAHVPPDAVEHDLWQRLR